MITNDRESIGDELGVYSIDDEDQLSPADTLDGDGDPLDRGYVAPERLHGSLAHGVTAREQAGDETIDQRSRQEVPDPYSIYGGPGPDEKDDGMVNDDDLDAIRAKLREDDHDFGSDRVGRLVAPDEGLREDREGTVVAREDRPTSWDSPEEAAMHYVDEDEVDDAGELTEVEWQPSDDPARDEDE